MTPVDEVRAWKRALVKKCGIWGAVSIAVAALGFLLWQLWSVVEVVAIIEKQAIEMAALSVMAVVVAILMVLLFEGRTRVQQWFMPSADENHALVDWIGRLVKSRSEKRNPLADLSPQMKAVEKEPVAMATLAGLGMIGAGLRSLGRYMLVAIIVMAFAWALAPFAASLAP